MASPEDTFIVDVDAHYTDQPEDFPDYLDEDDPWRRRYSVSHSALRAHFPPDTGTQADFEMPRKDARTRQDIIDIMEYLSMDAIVLISNQMLLFAYMSTDDRRQSKFAEAYVDYMLENVVAPDEGIYTVLPLSTQEPEATAEMIDETRNEDSIIAGCFATGWMNPPLGNRKYDVIYEAAERADLPLIFHGGATALDHFPVEGFSSPAETHMLGFLWANMGQITSLIIQGVPEKFPGVDFIFQECGLFYIPMMMYRMDSEYLTRSWDAPLLEHRPSEYLKDFYFGTQPLDHPPKEEYFEYVIDMIGGVDQLMYASDYPHPDFDDPSAITNWSFLTDDETAKIMGGNAREVFGI